MRSGRRTTSATSPSASQSAGRGNHFDARSSQRPSSVLAPRLRELLEQLSHAAVHSVEVRRVTRVVGVDLVLGRRRPHLPETAVRGRDERRHTRRRDRLALARLGQLTGGTWDVTRPPGRDGLAPSEGQVDGPPQQVPGVTRDATRVVAGMLANGFAADTRELRVVVVPAPRAVGESDEVLVHPRASGAEEPVEVDLVRAVRLARQEVVGDRTGELARGLSVLRRDDPIDDECAVERKPVPGTTHHREVVGSHRVVRGPDDERHSQGDAERGERRDPWSPCIAHEEQQRRKHDEDEAHWADQDEQRRARGRPRRPCPACAPRRAAPSAGRQARTRRRRAHRSRADGRAGRSPGRREGGPQGRSQAQRPPSVPRATSKARRARRAPPSLPLRRPGRAQEALLRPHP